jgi:thioredoxin
MEELQRGLTPICGRCKARIPIDPKTVAVNDATFATEVDRSPVPVLLGLWAPWCGPCRMIATMLEELAMERAGRVRVAELNIAENPATAARFGVRSIPTLLLIKGGREADRMVGVRPRAELERRLESLTAWPTGRPVWNSPNVPPGPTFGIVPGDASVARV